MLTILARVTEIYTRKSRKMRTLFLFVLLFYDLLGLNRCVFYLLCMRVYSFIVLASSSFHVLIPMTLTLNRRPFKMPLHKTLY